MSRRFDIDHVQIAIPVGGEDDARGYYGHLLGLTELAKPPEMAARGGCWFAVGGLQLHCGTEAEFRPAKKAHVALAVDDLTGLRTVIDRAGHTTLDDTPVDGRARFFSHDPFGNRIEFIERAT